MQRPRALRRGDAIGIVAPSGPIPSEELEKGVALLEARGYRVVVGENVLARHPLFDYLAGTDAQRASDLNAMLTRPDIQAVFCARGGYGAMRLFDRIAWEQIDPDPKIFLGYSDITSLHTALARRFHWVTFHGPMVGALSRLSAERAEVHWKLLESPEPFGLLPADPAAMTTVVGGSVEGELAGGCLCLLARACGSGFAPDFRGKIVLLEDVGEPVYRADRDLMQLKNAGLLDQAAGFVIGNITGWQKQEADPPNNTPQALWQEFFGETGKPVVTGFPFGHEADPLTLPLGVRARLDAGARTLTLLEPATHL
jgi:muramoyltetrapeptide carboxypeptidase